MARRITLFLTSKRFQRWLPTVVFIFVAVLAGLMLPQVMPNAVAVPEGSPVAAAASKDVLTYNPPSFPDGPDAQAMLLRLGLGTIVVLGLCVGTLWLGKRWFQVKAVPVAGDRQLRLAEVLPLSGRCCVYLIQAGSHQILAGVDGSGLKAIIALPETFEQTLSHAQAGELADPIAKAQPIIR